MSRHGPSIRDFFGPRASPVAPKPKLPAGKVEVANSDEEDEDLNSSLESLTDILRVRRDAGNTNTNSSRAPISKRLSPPRDHNPSLSTPPPKKYMFDLKSLVNEAKKDNATETSVRRAQALYDDEAQNPGGGGRLRSRDERDVDAMVLDVAMDDQEDGVVQRVMQALKRTEATHVRPKWYFFDTASPPKTTHKQFPAKSIKKDSWQHALVDPVSRLQTMESGVVKDMISLGESLPDEIVLWILDEIQSISRDSLRCAYCNLIGALPNNQLDRILQPELLRNLFKNMGGTDEAVELDRPISIGAFSPDPYLAHDWGALGSMISLLGQLGRRSQSSISKDIFCMLARLCIDTVVMVNLDLLASCQTAFSSLIESLSDCTWENDLQDMCHTIYLFTDLNPLRVQMLRCIPAYPPRLQELRRRLALSFFFEDPSMIKQPSSLSFSVSTVTAQLDEPQFNITKTTDYLNLAALMTLLDIAVDAAHSTQVNQQDKDVERAFNMEVDILLTRVKNIWNNITDTGASFISRIEAKEVIDGVRYRLMFGVRTKLKPKKSAFGQKKGKENFSPEIKRMAEFLEKANANKKTDGAAPHRENARIEIN